MGDAMMSDVTLDSIALSELNGPEARALLDTVSDDVTLFPCVLVSNEVLT
jgi:hypothetical protein